MLFLLLVLTNAPRLGWTKPLVLLGIGAGLFSGAAFISWEQRCKHPLLDLNTFRSATYSLGLVVACIGFMGTSAAYYLIPFYLQFVSGLTPASIGLALVPAGVVTALVSPLAGHTGDRFGHRRVATLGVTLLVAGLTCLSTLSPQTSTFWVSAFMAVLAVGLASFHAPNSSAVFADLPPEVFGVTSGSINLARNLGNVTGIAIATAIVTGTMSSRGFEPKLAAVQESGDPIILTAFVDGMTTSFVVFAALCMCLIALTFHFRRLARIEW
jgi:predicted MFS family arabinose efflux permease